MDVSNGRGKVGMTNTNNDSRVSHCTYSLIWQSKGERGHRAAGAKEALKGSADLRESRTSSPFPESADASMSSKSQLLVEDHENRYILRRGETLDVEHLCGNTTRRRCEVLHISHLAAFETFILVTHHRSAAFKSTIS